MFNRKRSTYFMNSIPHNDLPPFLFSFLPRNYVSMDALVLLDDIGENVFFLPLYFYINSSFILSTFSNILSLFYKPPSPQIPFIGWRVLLISDTSFESVSHIQLTDKTRMTKSMKAKLKNQKERQTNNNFYRLSALNKQSHIIYIYKPKQNCTEVCYIIV